MSRILAIDYGKKTHRCGCDGCFANYCKRVNDCPYTPTTGLYSEICGKEPVERIIVGHPKQMNNQESENMRNIVPFVNQLRKKLPDIPIEFVDERFTSVLAHQAMLDGGLKKKIGRIKL